MTGPAPVKPATPTGRTADLLADARETFGVAPKTTKVTVDSPAPLQGHPAPSGAEVDNDRPAVAPRGATRPDRR